MTDRYRLLHHALRLIRDLAAIGVLVYLRVTEHLPWPVFASLFLAALGWKVYEIRQAAHIINTRSDDKEST